MMLAALLNGIHAWSNENNGPDGVDGEPAQLDPPNLDYVAARLTWIEQYINQLRDPQTSPTLNPPDVGDPLPNNPTKTNEYALDFVILSRDAWAESLKTYPNHQYIGDRIATMTALLPGFRHAAGITP